MRKTLWGLHNRVRRQRGWRKTVLGAAGPSAEDDCFSCPNGWRTFQKGPGGRPRGTHPLGTGTYLSQILGVFLRITHPGPSREAPGAVYYRPALATGYSGSWGWTGSREKGQVMASTGHLCPGIMGCAV